jgi:glucose-6-phosphate dehydrogenase assembly protein OpcA
MASNILLEADADSLTGIEVGLSELSRRSGVSAGKQMVRAKTVNLIVRGTEDAESLALETLQRLSYTHPSRTIILASNDQLDTPGLRARIASECHPTADRVLCYERLSIETSERAAEHLVGIVRPLLVSHIPTCLWWIGDPGFSDDAFCQLAGISDRVIVDSQAFTKIDTDLKDLLDLVQGREVVVIDLNWQRLIAWREIIAQCFAGDDGLRHLNSLSSVTVRCSGQHPMQALLGLGWVASRLGWQVSPLGVQSPAIGTCTRQDIALTLESGDGTEGDLDHVTLITRGHSGEGRIDVARNGEQVVTTMRGGDLPELCRTTRYNWPSQADLLDVALGIRQHDEVFEKTIEAASQIVPLTLR